MKKIIIPILAVLALVFVTATSSTAQNVSKEEAKWCQAKCGQFKCPADKYPGFKRLKCVAQCEKPCAANLHRCLGKCNKDCAGGRKCNLDSCRNKCHGWQ